MQHDRTAKYPLDNPARCNYGHIFREAGGRIVGRSVMSYKTLCNEEGASCPRWGVLSVDEWLKYPWPLGFWAGCWCDGPPSQGDGGPAENLKTLMDNAPIVSQYR